MNTEALKIPFYELWQSLRRQGFDISLDAFTLLPTVLNKKGVPPTRADFVFLLQKLWLKPNDDVRLFEQNLAAFFQKEDKTELENEHKNRPTERQKPAEPSPQKPELDELNEDDNPSEKIPDTQDKIRITIRKTAETNHFKAQGETSEKMGGHFLLKGNYFPIKENQLKQAGLYLKKTGKVRQSDEINLTETVQEWARTGGLIQPIFESQKDIRVLWLIDDRGSMEPFAKMATLLTSSFQATHVEVYYFYNSLHKIYKNRTQIKGIELDQIRIDSHTCIFIFSDAGAAKGRMNTPRFLQNKSDFERCLSHSKRVVWINPVPQRRWKRTTAQKLSAAVPMFESDRNGIMAAVKLMSKIR
jgi:hypothetical protein